MDIREQDIKGELKQQIEKNKPFSLIKSEVLSDWINRSKLIKFKPGEKVISYGQINEKIYIIIQGTVRLLMNDETGDGLFTLDKRGPGQILGWTNLLRGTATEFVQASEETIALALPSKTFIDIYKKNIDFADYFNELPNIQEAYVVARTAAENMAERPKGWEEELKERISQSRILTVNSGERLTANAELPEGWNWHLSTTAVDNKKVGTVITSKTEPIRTNKEFNMPIRLVGIRKSEVITQNPNQALYEIASKQNNKSNTSLEQLGILETEKLKDEEKYPLVMGKGKLKEAMAVCEMIAISCDLPFKRDMVKKLFEEQFRRDKELSLDLLAGVCEVMGLNSQLAMTDTDFATSIEGPVIIDFKGICSVLHGREKNRVVVASPHTGIKRYTINELKEEYPES